MGAARDSLKRRCEGGGCLSMESARSQHRGSMAAASCACLGAVLAGACSFIDSGDIVLRLPEYPDPWAEVLAARGAAFSLYAADSSGLALVADSMPPGGRARFRAEDARFRAFIAYPEILGLRLRPAGALSRARTATASASAEGLEILLGFTGGWEASLAAELLAVSPEAAEGFDWLRLERELEERGGDPWILSPRDAAARVLDGSFTASLFHCMAGKEIRLPIAGYPPAPVTAAAWICESPFASAQMENDVIVLSWEPEGGEALYAAVGKALIRPSFSGALEAYFFKEGGVTAEGGW
jgi:hypothetical protein